MVDMLTGSDEIQHVSDTALMVAACRALETERPDGLVRDPYARKLAGPRGDAILQGISGWQLLCFGIGVRTTFLDTLISQTLAQHAIETVVSIGAGLDTRPWRLDLPDQLRWIEVDFETILHYKHAALAATPAKCRVERVAADITDSTQRDALFAAAGTQPALMITEGLLMYLPGPTIEALASEAAARGAVRHWLFDVSSLDLARQLGTDKLRALENVRAPGHLKGVEMLHAVLRHGWRQACFRSYSRDSQEVAAERIKVMMEAYTSRGIPLPKPATDDASGVYLVEI
jgi:methyltransferase (TIGR00027 family)